MKKILFIALAVGFLLFGVSAYLQSKPSAKNSRIYNVVKKYSPYYLDKRFGGLEILNREDKEFKEKPTNMKVFHRLEELEKKWAKEHLKLENNTLVIQDNNRSVLESVSLDNQDEIDFVHIFYGL